MGLKVKIRKSDKNLKALSKKVEILNKAELEVGHFDEQGKHYSGLSYPDLMIIHHFGVGDTGRIGQIPRRQTLSLFRFEMRKMNKSAALRRAFKTWAASELSKKDTDTMLDSIGQTLTRKYKRLFGEVSLFTPPTKSPKRRGIKGSSAPLVDRGDLRRNVAYRTSLNRRIKLGGR